MRFCSENQRRRPHEIRTWLTWRTKEYFFLKDNTNVHTTYTNTPCPCMFRFLLTIVTTRHHRLYLHQCFQRLRIFCSDQHLFDWQLYRNITGPSMARCFIDLDPETTEVHLLSALLQCRLKEPRYMLSVKLKPLHLMVLFETGIVDSRWIESNSWKNTCYSETTLFRMHPQSWWKMLEPHSNGDLEGIRKWA